MQAPLTVMLTSNKGKVMPCNVGGAGLLLHRQGPLFPPLSFSLDSIQGCVSSVYNAGLIYCRPKVFYTAVLENERFLRGIFALLSIKSPQYCII